VLLEHRLQDIPPQSAIHLGLFMPVRSES
jgi:hypothetical protein